jgi:hypothetical protein
MKGDAFLLHAAFFFCQKVEVVLLPIRTTHAKVLPANVRGIQS